MDLNDLEEECDVPAIAVVSWLGYGEPGAFILDGYRVSRKPTRFIVNVALIHFLAQAESEDLRVDLHMD